MPHKDPEVAREYRRIRYQLNRERILERQRAYERDNRERKRLYNAKYHAENRDAHLEYFKDYGRKNPLAESNRRNLTRARRKQVVAVRRGVRWDSSEDAVLFSPDYVSDVHRAIYLGRTVDAVANRRFYINQTQQKGKS